MKVKPRKEYVIVKTEGVNSVGMRDVYFMEHFMERRYVLERLAKRIGLTPDPADYVATGLSYKQAKQMMKLFKEQ
jgi:hypothetical protein